MKVVVSQPMYLPWIGFVSQIAMADIIVWLDDAAFSKGSFTNRVQLKNENGIAWLSIPLDRKGKNHLISELKCSKPSFQNDHYQKLKNLLHGCSYHKHALNLFDDIWKKNDTLCKSIIRSSELLLASFGAPKAKTFLSSQLNCGGNGSDRVLNIVKYFSGTSYITGHGAKNYLDHLKFENAGISVEYMKYGPYSWPQTFGQFNPFVSAIDIVANVEFNQRKECLVKETTPWHEFLNSQSQKVNVQKDNI